MSYYPSEKSPDAPVGETELEQLRQRMAEELSEIVSDVLDPSVNVVWMRGSPDLPKYVRGLEAELVELRQRKLGSAKISTSITLATIAAAQERAEKSEAALAKSEAACAEMRDALDEHTSYVDIHDNIRCCACERVNNQCKDSCPIKHALSLDSGKGWVSPEEAAQIEQKRDAKWQSGIEEVIGEKLNWHNFNDSPSACDSLKRFVETLRESRNAAVQMEQRVRVELNKVRADNKRLRGALKLAYEWNESQQPSSVHLRIILREALATKP